MRTGQHQLPNCNWKVTDDHRNASDVHHAILATLMDIRAELRGITSRLDCHETLALPNILRRIARNTTKPKKRKKS